ncbi:MAG: YncE family protein, partial [Flavobacteriaceae bacterium]|nr:YncE family protein [Flavobacteriaceae bacterium]
MKIFIRIIILILFTACGVKNISENKPQWVISAPSGYQITKINEKGKTVIPNGRLITPSGKNIMTAPHPYGLTLSPNGNVAVTANSGTNPLSITIVRDIMSDHPQVQQVPPGPASDKGVLASVFMGLAISPDNKTIYVAGGQENKVYLFDVNTGAKKDSIDCSFKAEAIDYRHGYIGDMKLSKDGKTLYAVDQIGFRMVILNTETKKLTHSVPVGRYPFGICLSPDEKKAYVANVGM